MGTRKISTSAQQERELREAAIEDATNLFARHGSSAVAMVSDRLVDQSRSPEQRRCDRLTLLAVERLDRDRRQGSSGGTTLVVWKPPLFSWAGISALFGLKPRRRR